MDLALNNLQRLICHKTQTNKTSNGVLNLLLNYSIHIIYKNEQKCLIPVFLCTLWPFKVKRITRFEIIRDLHPLYDNIHISKELSQIIEFILYRQLFLTRTFRQPCWWGSESTDYNFCSEATAPPIEKRLFWVWRHTAFSGQVPVLELWWAWRHLFSNNNNNNNNNKTLKQKSKLKGKQTKGIRMNIRKLDKVCLYMHGNRTKLFQWEQQSNDNVISEKNIIWTCVIRKHGYLIW